MAGKQSKSMSYQSKQAPRKTQAIHVNRETGEVYGLSPVPDARIDPNLWRRTKSAKSAARRRCKAGHSTFNRQSKLSYVLLDTGAWGDDPLGKAMRVREKRKGKIAPPLETGWEKRFRQRNFGLVCGRNVWLCDFIRTGRPGWSALPPPNKDKQREAEKALLKKFVDEVEAKGCSICVQKYAWAEGLACPSPKILYVFLPDMHIPAYPHWPVFGKLTDAEEGDLQTMDEDGWNTPTSEKILTLRQKHSAKDLKRMFGEYDQFRSRDIFGEYGGESICEFLGIIAGMDASLRRNTCVVNTGDMYELWQGTGQWTGYLEKAKDGKKGLTLKPEGYDAIWKRIKGIHAQNRKVIDAFKAIEKAGCKTVFTYGNHDVYLADALSGKDPRWADFLKHIPSRQTGGYKDGMLAEHGHRHDPGNQDGLWIGPFATELAYTSPKIRSLESVARKIVGSETDYVSATAKDVYYLTNSLPKPYPVGILVMAHTHKPDLSVVDVKVVRVRADPNDKKPTL